MEIEMMQELEIRREQIREQERIREVGDLHRKISLFFKCWSIWLIWNFLKDLNAKMKFLCVRAGHSGTLWKYSRMDKWNKFFGFNMKASFCYVSVERENCFHIFRLGCAAIFFFFYLFISEIYLRFTFLYHNFI